MVQYRTLESFFYVGRNEIKISGQFTFHTTTIYQSLRRKKFL